MLNVKQIAVIASVIVLMGVLLSLDIKGLVKEETGNTGATSNGAAPAAAAINVESISLAAKQSITANLAQQVTELEGKLKEAKGDEKVKVQKELAALWSDVNQPAPAAFYFQEVATAENNFTNWLKAGDSFTEGYQNSTDSLVQPVLVQHAITSYKKASELDPKSLDAKAGLGIAYVNELTNPMQGIQLLLDVVKEDPAHVKANMNLGLFSIRSGQYDKAIDRFKTVITHKPNPEAWFYLASCYESMGMNQESIAAYEKSKELAADPSLSAFVDKKIEELRK